MMYQLRVNAFCEHASDFDDVLDKLDDLKPDMKVINPGQENQECSTIDLIENHHDEPPPHPCHPISHWDNCPLSPP